jgi:hypothetical protein
LPALLRRFPNAIVVAADTLIAPPDPPAKPKPVPALPPVEFRSPVNCTLPAEDAIEMAPPENPATVEVAVPKLLSRVPVISPAALKVMDPPDLPVPVVSMSATDKPPDVVPKAILPPLVVTALCSVIWPTAEILKLAGVWETVELNPSRVMEPPDVMFVAEVE